jgi:N-acetylglucosamine malate deacetylase 1
MKLPGRILFVGAHCDDIELAAGGLLARACFDRLDRIGVLVFSDHRGVVDLETASASRREMRSNLDWLSRESGSSIEDHTEFLLEACGGAFPAERGRICAALEAMRPHYDLVVTHAAADTNQDHRQVAEEAIRAFKADVTLLSGEFPANDLGAFRPELFVSLGEREIGAKVRMISAYRSQQFGGRPYFDDQVVVGLARLRGSQIREKYAEAYQIGARLIVRGPA